MYFIARNNRIYNYIAHTSLRRCYGATLFAVSAFFIIGSYGAYFPLLAHIVLLQSERAILFNKVEELAQFDKSSQELNTSIESGKKKIDDYATVAGNREQGCHKRMLFVLDAVAKSELTLNTYGACKEKDKEWYIKNSAHFDITGSLQKIMSFLETIKKSRHMITLSQVTVTRVADDLFKMGCEVGLVTIKK